MTRRATIRTAHADPETVAAALAPDNTDEMDTRVERVAHGDDAADRPADAGADEPAGDADESTGDDAVTRRVVTEIERESTSGLQSTIDDTLVNLAVADEVAALARSGDAARADDPTASDRDAATAADGSTADDAPTTEDAQTDDRQRTDTNDTS